MTPLKIALVGVLGIGIAASLAFADHKPNHPGGGDTGGVTGTWVFAGYTLATTNGGVTLPVIYEMCLSEFGADARMALFEEWVKSPNIKLPAASVWINPDPVSSGSNCVDWTNGGGASGSTITSNGNLFDTLCSNSLAVACVVPQ